MSVISAHSSCAVTAKPLITPMWIHILMPTPRPHLSRIVLSCIVIPLLASHAFPESQSSLFLDRLWQLPAASSWWCLTPKMPNSGPLSCGPSRPAVQCVERGPAWPSWWTTRLFVGPPPQIRFKSTSFLCCRDFVLFSAFLTSSNPIYSSILQSFEKSLSLPNFLCVLVPQTQPPLRRPEDHSTGRERVRQNSQPFAWLPVFNAVYCMITDNFLSFHSHS